MACRGVKRAPFMLPIMAAEQQPTTLVTDGGSAKRTTDLPCQERYHENGLRRPLLDSSPSSQQAAPYLKVTFAGVDKHRKVETQSIAEQQHDLLDVSATHVLRSLD